MSKLTIEDGCPKCGGDLVKLGADIGTGPEKHCTECNWHILVTNRSEKSDGERIDELERRVEALEQQLERAVTGSGGKTDGR